LSNGAAGVHEKKRTALFLSNHIGEIFCVKEKIGVGFRGRFFFLPESNDSFGRVFHFWRIKRKKKEYAK
jgi:hypothetical protein